MKSFNLFKGALVPGVVMMLVAGLAGCESTPQGPDTGVQAESLLKGGKTSTTIPLEIEPNDDPHYNIYVVGSQLGGSVKGNISTATDVDYFLSHGVLPGKEVSVTLSVPAGKDYDIQILDYNTLEVLASRHASAGVTESLRYRNNTPTMNDYFFKVFSSDGSYSPTAYYVMTVGKVI
jgi:hypothetical protein